MTIAPRISQTVNQTLKSLRDNKIDNNVFVFAEPGEYKINDDNVCMIRNDKKLGAFKNFHQAISYFDIDDDEYLMYLQDDFILGELDCIEYKFHKMMGFISLYTDWRNKEYITKEGWEAYHMGWRMCGACFIIRGDVLKRLLKHKYYNRHLNNYKPNKQIDACIGRCMKELGVETHFHNPSLAKHVGYTSTLGHEGQNNNSLLGFYHKPCEQK